MLFSPEAQSNGPSDHGLKPLKPQKQNKPFLLLSWFAQVFCQSDKKLTNTPMELYKNKDVEALLLNVFTSCSWYIIPHMSYLNIFPL
jgi:hypothetical protein